MTKNLIEPRRLDAVLAEELSRNYSRETVTLKSGTTYKAGTVLGRITDDDTYTLSPPVPDDDNDKDGSEQASAVLLHDADATVADYADAVVAVRGVVVKAAGLIHHASVDDAAKRAAKAAQLAKAGIVVRDSL